MFQGYLRSLIVSCVFRISRFCLVYLPIFSYLFGVIQSGWFIISRAVIQYIRKPDHNSENGVFPVRSHSALKKQQFPVTESFVEMGNPLRSVWEFLNYWYFRYLMVTELYMVEKWERVICNITIVLFFSLLSYINYKILDFSGLLWKPTATATATASPVNVVSYT